MPGAICEKLLRCTALLNGESLALNQLVANKEMTGEPVDAALALEAISAAQAAADTFADISLKMIGPLPDTKASVDDGMKKYRDCLSAVSGLAERLLSLLESGGDVPPWSSKECESWQAASNVLYNSIVRRVNPGLAAKTLNDDPMNV